jgi:diketogulonate reductase-like aldo/keto reductase
MKKYGVQAQAWAPFARGKNNLFTDEILRAIGDKYNKSNAQVALRYLVQNDVAAVHKTSKKERMIENLDVFDFELTSEDMGKIAAIDKGETSFFSHQDPEQVERLVNWERSF